VEKSISILRSTWILGSLAEGAGRSCTQTAFRRPRPHCRQLFIIARGDCLAALGTTQAVYLQREVASAVASTKVPHRCKLQGEMTARQIVLDCDLMLTKRRKNVSSPNTNVSKPHTKRFKVQYTRFKSQYKRFTIVKIMRGDNDLELFFKICQ